MDSGLDACASPRNDEARRRSSAFSRRVFARALQESRPSRSEEGAGKAGCTTHPLPCVQNKKTHAGQHRYAEITPAFPAPWLYGLLRALPGVPGLLASVALSIIIDKA